MAQNGVLWWILSCKALQTFEYDESWEISQIGECQLSFKQTMLHIISEYSTTKSVHGDQSDHTGKTEQYLSKARTLVLDSVPLREQMCVSLTSALWPSSAGEGLAIGRSLAQDAPPTVYIQDAEIRKRAYPEP